MKINEVIHGFKFISEKEIPELSGTLREAVYEKNGAKLLFIDREDSNKTFAITFKTIPTDDTGVFHIIEHSVLCGSDKYPVKEPFVELLKGSLKTFLNAFTFSDKTMYPVSSRNDKDFLNLISVYMDAVLHPAAIKKPEIFYQEGWHYELHDKEEELVYKGVVFNEMKGAYSSADELMMQKTASLLYKGSPYGKDSGGDPEFITDLTYEQFVSAHAKYYHPSNARIVLDGSVDLDKTLALLDEFLSEYEYLPIDYDIPKIEKIGHREETLKYEISSSEDVFGKARVALGFLTFDYTEREKLFALAVLCDSLAGSNEAPLKKKMLESGICEDFNIIPYDGIQENSIIIEIKNVKEERIEEAKALFLSCVHEIIDTGLDKKLLLASYNSLEFRTREQDMATFPAGIAYAVSSMDTWLYGGDPYDGLAFETIIESLRKKLDTDYYEKLLSMVFFESKHSSALYMLPSNILGEQRAEHEREKLASIKALMSDDEIFRVMENTKTTEEWQKTSDTKEQLDTIPSLAISDIEREPEKYPIEEYRTDSIPSLYIKAASRGITYTKLLFDISDFSEDELYTAALLTELIKNVATDKSDVISLQTKIKTELGAFGLSTRVSTKNGIVTPYLSLNVSCLDSKRDSAAEIIEEVLLHTFYTDKKTIGRIVKQLRLASAEGIAASGHMAALSRAAAYVSAEAAIGEYFDGIESYLRTKKLDADFDELADELITKLQAVSEKAFTKKRLILCHSGERADSYIEKLSKIFPAGEEFKKGSNITPIGNKKEGILIPAAIAFAAKAGNIYNYQNEIHGSLGVVRSILSYAFLWNEIRVQGGAYGAGFLYRNNGICGSYTYRDPSPKRSLEIFDKCAAFLREFADSEDDITTFIIGAIGDTDPLITPKVISALSLGAYLRGQTHEDRIRERQELLSVKKEDIYAAAELLDKIAKSGGVCVVGSREKLDSCADILNEIIEI